MDATQELDPNCTEDKLLTSAEAAKYLGLSQAWFARDRWSGCPTIPFIRVAKRTVRYRLSDLLEHLAKNTVHVSK